MHDAIDADSGWDGQRGEIYLKLIYASNLCVKFMRQTGLVLYDRLFPQSTGPDA